MKDDINLKNPLSWISIGFGAGLFPIAPGTFGSLIAAFIYLFLINPFLESNFYLTLYLIFIIFSFWIGIIIYPRTTGELKDPGYFVWDEFVGMWIACIPLSFFQSTFEWLIVAVIIFRIFDIWKPWIIQKYDLMEGGFGVMMDDVIAGLFTSIILFLFFLFSI